MNLESTTNALEDLNDKEIQDLQPFETDFLIRTNTGLARCVDPKSKPFSIRSDNQYDITFVEPAYVSNVEIEFSKPAFGAGIELAIFDSLSNRNVRRRVAKDTFSEIIQFSVKCVTSGISILLQPTIFEMLGKRTLEVKAVRIVGYFQNDFEELTKTLNQLEGYRESAIAELTKEKNDLQARYEKVLHREQAVETLEAKKQEELQGLEKNLEEVAEAIDLADAKLDVLQENVASNEKRKQTLIEQISNYESTSRNIEGEIAKGKEHLRAIAVETSDKESRLKVLTSNVNLFSEEFSSFSDHGAKQVKTFIGLSVIPLLIIAVLTIQLLMGAVDLSVKYTKEPNLDLMTVFVTRLPYLAVCGSILGICFTAIKFLFNRISIIYAERLDFAKIGILAKDVASASAHDISFVDEQLYEARTYLKIQMLKSYLSGNIGAFVYHPRKFEVENKASGSEEQTDSGALDAESAISGADRTARTEQEEN